MENEDKTHRQWENDGKRIDRLLKGASSKKKSTALVGTRTALTDFSSVVLECTGLYAREVERTITIRDTVKHTIVDGTGESGLGAFASALLTKDCIRIDSNGNVQHPTLNPMK